MSSYVVSENKGERIYYNVTIPHNDETTFFGRPTLAAFYQTRDQPLFPGPPSDYYLSVVRFTLPTATVPIQIVSTVVNPVIPSDPNYMQETVTLSYLGNDYQTHMIYVTSDLQVPTPGPPDPAILTNLRGTDVILYYSVYSYQHYIDMINTALLTSYTALHGAFPLLFPTGAPPFMSYSSATELFTVTIPISFITNNVQLFMNGALYSNFEGSFDVVYQHLPALNGKDVMFRFVDQLINEITLPNGLAPPNNLYVQAIQNINALNQLTSFQNILLLSTSLPVRHEWINNNYSGLVANYPTQNSFLPIVTDFEVDLSNRADAVRPYIHYLPTAEYRRTELTSVMPIYTIDLQFYWRDNFNNIYPVTIPRHANATIKILFEKKKKL